MITGKTKKWNTYKEVDTQRKALMGGYRRINKTFPQENKP
jgi:hypothetical protein